MDVKAFPTFSENNQMPRVLLVTGKLSPLSFLSYLLGRERKGPVDLQEATAACELFSQAELAGEQVAKNCLVS